MSGLRKLATARALKVGWLAVFAAGLGLGHLGAQAQNGLLPSQTITEPLVTAAARQVGVRRCLPAIAAVAKRTTNGATQQDVIIDWDRQAPDTASFFSLTGLGNGTQRAALTIAANPTPRGCSILVERMSASDQPCAQIAANELPGFRSGVLIEGITVYQNPQVAGETYTLVENPSGCMIIRRQATMKWPIAR